MEYEIRRSSSLTIELLRKFESLNKIETNFMLYWNDLRVYINGDNPHIERKTILNIKPIFLNLITLEICYESKEETVSISLLYDIIKNGNLVKKTVYFKTEDFILYTLENVEINLNGLKNKCVIELENPFSAAENIKKLYLQCAIVYDLHIDDKHVSYSVENVLQNSSFTLDNEIKYPKIDGERGLLNFYSEYEVFTSNTNSVILKPPLYKEWGRKYSFYLKNITFVAETTPTHLVLIDLALSKQFGASKRMEFIINLAQRIRKHHPVESGVILFQGFDVDYIRSQNIKIDGYITIRDDRLYKFKNISTVDLLFFFGKLVDRNGICYKLVCTNSDLTNNNIYECILNGDGEVVNIIKNRHDKFFPNSRKTILYILNSTKNVEI